MVAKRKIATITTQRYAKVLKSMEAAPKYALNSTGTKHIEIQAERQMVASTTLSKITEIMIIEVTRDIGLNV